VLTSKIRTCLTALRDGNLLEKARGYFSRRKWIWDDARSVYAPDDFKLYWETLLPVADYQRSMITGDRDLDPLQYAVRLVGSRFPGGNLRGCMLGCNEGMPEIQFLDSGLFESVEVHDIAGGLLEKQRHRIRELGIESIRYIRADLNRHMFEPSVYDVVFSWGTIHHVADLDHLFTQVRRALKPGGMLIARDYVGPSRLQFTDRQLAVANVLLKCIPEKYRRTANGSAKIREVRMSEGHYRRTDPSEAASSQDLLAIMRKRFTFDLFRETGGALLHPLLNGIAGNFEKDGQGMRILESLIEIEKNLTEGGLLPSDYVFLVASPKEGESAGEVF
jgi:SAM-dependent methyltransferase